MPACSVIVRCYNEEKDIGRLVQGLAQQTFRDYELVVVDSGSTDRTLRVVGPHADQIIPIKPEDFSFGRALNAGCRAARGDLLVFASAHVYPVHRDWLSSLMAPLAQPEVALAYGKQRGGAGSRFSEQRVFAQWFGEASQLGQPHPFCNNANAAIRREAWARQPYDETLTGLEDVAWARKAMESGARLAYVAEAEVIHLHHESPRRIYNRYLREAMALKKIFPEQTFTALDFVRLLAANTWADARAARQQGRLRASAGEIAMFRLMQFWGTYRGYRTPALLNRHLRERFYYPQGAALPAAASQPAAARPLVDYSCRVPEPT